MRVPTSKEWEREPFARTTQVGTMKAPGFGLGGFLIL
jgi:hypothetical protein